MVEVDISTPANPGCILRIDERDLHLVDGIRWTPDRRANGLVYAHRRPSGETKAYLHRLIMQPPSGFVVDHIDRNGLNNTRANLRVVRTSTNAWNKAGRGVSAFKGVHYDKGKWAAEIKEGRVYRLGRFQDEVDAALAFDAAALFFGRDRTGLNFPDRDTKPSFELKCKKENPLGVPGIRQLCSGRFNARPTIKGRKVCIGTFDTLAEAAAAIRERAA